MSLTDSYVQNVVKISTSASCPGSSRLRKLALSPTEPLVITLLSKLLYTYL